MSSSLQQYCLRWNSYQDNMSTIFYELLLDECFIDVTLACAEATLRAHKIVLSACSPYFKRVLLDNPCKHPIIIMPAEVSINDLKHIIDFMYRGAIEVSHTELQSVLRAADQLKINGLLESTASLPHHVLAESVQSPNSLDILSNVPSSPDVKPLTSEAAESRHCSKDRPRGQKRRRSGESKLNSELETSTSPLHDSEPTRNEIVDRPSSDMSIAAPGQQSSSSIFPHFGGVDVDDDFPPEPAAPSAIPVDHSELSRERCPSGTLILSDSDSHKSANGVAMLSSSSNTACIDDGGGSMVFIKKEEPDSNDEDGDQEPVHFEELHVYEQDHLLDLSAHMAMVEQNSMMNNHYITLQSLRNGNHNGCYTDGSKGAANNLHGSAPPKTWKQEDMELALNALRTHNMSLTKASAMYGIPSTTLWQRAHRMGIDTPKKDGTTKSWTEENLNSALEALRTGNISANKASKTFGIPSSTLYKIARREGIRLTAPFNAVPTTWTPENLEKALESIRSGLSSVQKASTEFGIPTGTLYGRCKREGIELSRSNPTPWSEVAMNEALETVRMGQMSINQAALHYNLPYSSLYGRFKRGLGKGEAASLVATNMGDLSGSDHSFSEDSQSSAIDMASVAIQFASTGPHHFLEGEQLTNDGAPFTMVVTEDDTPPSATSVAALVGHHLSAS